MAGCAELAHDERIQRSPQGRSHFPRDGNPAAGQTQHHDILLAAVRTQQIGQYAARLTAVTKDPPRAPRIRLALMSLLYSVPVVRHISAGMSRFVGDGFDVVRRDAEQSTGQIG